MKGKVEKRGERREYTIRREWERRKKNNEESSSSFIVHHLQSPIMERVEEPKIKSNNYHGLWLGIECVWGHDEKLLLLNEEIFHLIQLNQMVVNWIIIYCSPILIRITKV